MFASATGRNLYLPSMWQLQPCQPLGLKCPTLLQWQEWTLLVQFTTGLRSLLPPKLTLHYLPVPAPAQYTWSCVVISHLLNFKFQWPQTRVSDNGKTFVARGKWLSTLKKDHNLASYTGALKIRWKFNLAQAPWWGGFFERLIGIMKRAL